MNHEHLKALALAAKDESQKPGWYEARTLEDMCGLFVADAEYIAAASPDVVLALIAENERLREALKDIIEDYSDRFDLESPSTNPGIKIVIKQARAALKETT